MGKCQFTSQKLSFWLSVLTDFDQFGMPPMQTIKQNTRESVSRCRVCMKDPQVRSGQENIRTL
jgi:hypothetical protein